jgi:hypothetical protein
MTFEQAEISRLRARVVELESELARLEEISYRRLEMWETMREWVRRAPHQAWLEALGKMRELEGEQ